MAPLTYLQKIGVFVARGLLRPSAVAKKDEMQCEIQCSIFVYELGKTVMNCECQKIRVQAMTPNLLLRPLCASIKRQYIYLSSIYSKAAQGCAEKLALCFWTYTCLNE